MFRCRRRRRARGSARLDAEVLLLRLGLGAVFAAHGAQQLFGWFGGGGLEGTAKGMERMGFRPGRPAALMSGLSQAGGGALLALGLATPLGGAAAAGSMTAAGATHASNGFFNVNGGWELSGVLGGAAAAIGVLGPGRYAVDRALGDRLNRPLVRVVCFGGTAAVTAAVLRRRDRALAADVPGTTDFADEAEPLTAPPR
ncbi:DoxX family protein [Streptomyces sp. 6N223]|uniref:DoxX family protein n=1 Tax=Streptomyces sp. 6N223 TaxID=3457412 RepID=UPI003FD5699E